MAAKKSAVHQINHPTIIIAKNLTLLQSHCVPGEIFYIYTTVPQILPYYVAQDLLDVGHYVLPTHGHIFLIHNNGLTSNEC